MPAPKKVSKKGREFIASWEGLELEAYQVEGENFWTIGVGHTGLVDGKRIRKGMKITRAKAMQLLAQDLAEVEKAIRAEVPWRWRNRRKFFDALASIAFNTGPAVLTPEPPLESLGKALRAKEVNRRTVANVVNAFELYVKGGTPLRTMPGLVRRRQAETHLFQTGEYRNNR